EKHGEVLDPLHVVMLGLRHELADRHVFDHAPAQRADGLVGHGGAPVLSEVVEHLDLTTGRFHRLRLLIITRAAPQAPYRERFSPLTPSGRRPDRNAALRRDFAAAPICYALTLGWGAMDAIRPVEET